ncbi:DUF1681-domain-containing protein [Coniochaeta ligniaria NRRL 30616]|uniref:DUF1681-domain-containing protein n=1 Tax=Coniochaeta ligniaria NRRL 30616 TaxID=1408157 RepID=A0A1J7IWP8_9PEZI|nr:DUF1681-domain-containing protein [Coniochaeta ligniaria NRRL 30616]
METLDPATGLPLPPNAIQRVLFVAPKVHIYNIPPLASTRGYVAASWTDDPKRHIFTCRMRLLETATPGRDDSEENIKADIILEDPASGTLFAAAPYTTPAIVESALDSSRFFALRVQDPSGRKATLGMGFEDRSDAFDFSVALQEARKSLGMEPEENRREKEKSKKKEEEEVKRDYSLKEGETITVSFGGSGFGRRNKGRAGAPAEEEEVTGSLNSFALPPPPGAAAAKGGGIAPPPLPAAAGGGGSRQKAALQDFGFDDGQFGEFA